MNPYYYEEEEFFNAVMGATAAIWIFGLLFAVVAVIALWQIFRKAGEEGWAAIVPYYNLYVLYKITWGNGWFFLLLLIPFANFVIGIITLVKLAKAFGKGGGFACGLIFLNFIFMLILAFSKDIQYVGVPGKEPVTDNFGGYGQNPNAQGGFRNPYAQGGQQNQYQQSYQQNPYQQPPQQGSYQQQSAENPQYHYQTTQNSNSQHFCPGCGEQLLEGIKFCPKCGMKQEQ